ncbi:hypothetical protein BU23DRAFT_573823 [Bimuria novae-zelandiae CBS 107.79]|uniref:Uncharacterized protein n=1 Tax=Bimuria novae-zelandiae CBS 107.79 TaxID=1447943 RepID=A0A6A5UQ99_9PLEO|nr:hypothetical protein BU23DRAFT_573823 [Bimuria novae-zelandiae CBS 107.79]
MDYHREDSMVNDHEPEEFFFDELFREEDYTRTLEEQLLPYISTTILDLSHRDLGHKWEVHLKKWTQINYCARPHCEMRIFFRWNSHFPKEYRETTLRFQQGRKDEHMAKLMLERFDKNNIFLEDEEYLEVVENGIGECFDVKVFLSFIPGE